MAGVGALGCEAELLYNAQPGGEQNLTTHCTSSPRFSIVCSWYLLSADSNWPGTRGKKHGGLKLPPVLWGLQEPTRHQLVGEI